MGETTVAEDETPEHPSLAKVRALIDGLSDMIDRHIETALAPVLARVAELERQVAELTATIADTPE